MSTSPARAQAQAICCSTQPARTDVHRTRAACGTCAELQTASSGTWLCFAAASPATHCTACPNSRTTWPPSERAPQEMLTGNRWLLPEWAWTERASHGRAAGLALAASTCSPPSQSCPRGVWEQRRSGCLRCPQAAGGGAAGAVPQHCKMGDSRAGRRNPQPEGEGSKTGT